MANTEMVTGAVSDLQSQVEQFLYHESDLMDRREFGEWLNLFTPNAIYWIPSGVNDVDPTRHVSLVYDNLKALSERVWRFGSGLAYAQQPASRTARLISNVQITSVVEEDNKTNVHVQAKSLTAEFRRGAQTNHAARVSYTLELEDGDFRIVVKKIELINSDGYLGNMGLPL